MIHRVCGKLSFNHRRLRRQYIDPSKKVFHIPTDVFQDTTATCARWCSRRSDMYATVFKADPLDLARGDKYRHCILNPRGSREELDSLEAG